MSGRRPFRELARQVTATPEGRQRVDDYRRLMDAVVSLDRLREERGLTQVEVANLLEVTQGNISRLEHASDLYLSTLSRYVEALGGHLELTAVFPDEVVSVAVPDADLESARAR
jgi:predicted transcriptional regulator